MKSPTGCACNSICRNDGHAASDQGHYTLFCAADGRMRLATRRRGMRRLTPTSLIGGDAGIGVIVTINSFACSPAVVAGVGISTDASNARPASVICEPVSSRRTMLAFPHVRLRWKSRSNVSLSITTSVSHPGQRYLSFAHIQAKVLGDVLWQRAQRISML